MSDEEKKAIEDLKEVIDLYNDECLITTEDDFKSIKILLNLIEKQSKEIEELKEKDDANLAYYDQIYQNGIYTGQKAVEEKIKAKIEELEKEYTGCTTNVFSVLQSLLEKEHVDVRILNITLLEKE